MSQFFFSVRWKNLVSNSTDDENWRYFYKHWNYQFKDYFVRFFSNPLTCLFVVHCVVRRCRDIKRGQSWSATDLATLRVLKTREVVCRTLHCNPGAVVTQLSLQALLCERAQQCWAYLLLTCGNYEEEQPWVIINVFLRRNRLDKGSLVCMSKWTYVNLCNNTARTPAVEKR